MELRNVMEDTVMHTIKQILPTTGCCQCERCQLDIASYALNRLPAKYVVSEEGELISRFITNNGQEGLDVTTVVVKAIQIISKHPNH